MSSFLGTPESIREDILAAVVADLRLDAARETGLRERMTAEYDAVYARNVPHYEDEPGRKVAALSSAVLACRNVLVRDEGVDPQTILALVARALIVPRRPAVKDWLASRMGITAQAPQEAFRQSAENFKARGESVFGASFTYVQERQSPDENYVQVRKCAFNDFFRRNGVPELTSLFCALDTLWADYLNSGEFNVSFERPSVLSEGADACRFYFVRRR